MYSRRKPNKHKRKFREVWSYTFDNLMLKGMLMQIALLLLLTLLVTVVLGIGLILVTDGDMSVGESLWASYNHTLDPGTLYGDDGSVPFLFVLFLATIFGVIFTGFLIGIINNGMEEKMNNLAKGRAKIVEKYSHTLILGFSNTTTAILSELVKANDNNNYVYPVVIMDDVKSTEEMMDEIKNYVDMPKKVKTKFIVRSGCIYDSDDLKICALENCESIIINAKDDFETIKSILACNALIEQYEKDGKDVSKIGISAVIYNEENEIEAKIAGGSRLTLLCYDRIMSKIISGSGRETGISHIYSDLFDYDGLEFYTVDKEDIESVAPKGTGKYDFTQYIKNAVVVGGIPNLEDTSYKLFLPSTDREFNDYKKYFVLQDDDDPILKVDSSKKPAVKEELFADYKEHRTADPITMLILGTNPMINTILKEEDEYFENAKSKVIVARNKGAKSYLKEELINSLKNLDVTVIEEEIYKYDVVKKIATKDIDSVVVLGDSECTERESDEKVLTELIYLRDLRENNDDINFNITCEIKLDRDRILAEFTGANDFIVGSSIISTMVTQVSQTPELYDAFVEVLGNQGSEIYMKPVTDYIKFTSDVVKVDYYTLIKAVERYDEVWIGLHLAKNEHEYANPVLVADLWDNKNNRPVEIELHKNDELVVIAE